MKLVSPWVNFYREIEALFMQDPEVNVVYDEAANHLKLFVDDARKADAIRQLLPTEKTFGNVKMTIEVVPANDGAKATVDVIQEAFRDNPVLSYIYKAQTPLGEFDYAVFRKEVVQYYNDDMGDLNGNRSTLYQELAKDVFGTDKGVYFCTEA